MEYTKLSNGVEMPMLGYGVFQIDDATCERCVSDALTEGYRLIDTAQAYFNERAVGAAIAASDLPRDEVFVVDKVWVSNYGEGKTYASIKASLALMGLDHIDLMLLHQPFNDYYGAWRDMERAYEEGLVRAIGVSNFDPVRLLDICTFARIKPMVNQVEIHAFRQQQAAIENMRKLAVRPMAWGPFAEGMNNFFANPLLAEVGAEHGKTVGQTALRYLMDCGVVVIPKSTHRERMAENLDCFDFSLTPEDTARIKTLDTPGFTCYDHSSTEVIGGLLSRIKSMM